MNKSIELTETVKADALAALDGMREIVRAEMLTTGLYVEEEVSDPSRAAAICGGRKHCAIGSLWVGAGVDYEFDDWEISLPGTAQLERGAFVAERPALALALDALNSAAEEFARREGMELGSGDAIEALFEGHYFDGESDLTKRDLLGIIAAAKRRINAAKP